jgi:hypothetical protein
MINASLEYPREHLVWVIADEEPDAPRGSVPSIYDYDTDAILAKGTVPCIMEAADDFNNLFTEEEIAIAKRHCEKAVHAILVLRKEIDAYRERGPSEDMMIRRAKENGGPCPKCDGLDVRSEYKHDGSVQWPPRDLDCRCESCGHVWDGVPNP